MVGDQINMKKNYLIVIIVITCICILCIISANKQNKEIGEAGSFSHEESFYDYEEPEETSDDKKGGSLSHREYFYNESEEIPEDEDGLTPIRSHTYEAVEEEWKN